MVTTTDAIVAQWAVAITVLVLGLTRNPSDAGVRHVAGVHFDRCYQHQQNCSQSK